MKTKVFARYVLSSMFAAVVLLTAGSVFAEQESGGINQDRPPIADQNKGITKKGINQAGNKKAINQAGINPAVESGMQQIAGTVTKVDPRTKTFTVRGEGIDITLPAAKPQLLKVGQRVKITIACTYEPLNCTITIEL